MKSSPSQIAFVASISVMAAVGLGFAGDWPMMGRDASRNAVSPEKNPPLSWQIEVLHDTGRVMKAAVNVKWQAQLGSISRGGPVVANGLVWVGTNNQHPRDPKNKGDAAVLMCFRESDGKFLYQYVSPRLKEDLFQDWPIGSMSSPLIEGDRLWLVTNRCETICLDIGPLQRGKGEPKIVWAVDMRKELGVHPRSSGMGLLANAAVGPVFKEFIYVNTSNGKGEDNQTLHADAPSLVCLNKNTGKVVWKDNSPGKNVMLGQFSSPLLFQANGRAQLVMGQGDGWLRSFEPETGKLIWKCDLNPKSATFTLNGRGNRKYAVATPVFHENRIYLGLAIDPEFDAGGPSRFLCIDATKAGDISPELDDGPGNGKPNPSSGVVWQFGEPRLDKKSGKNLIGDIVASCVVQDGLVYVVESEGFFHCLDAITGKQHWTHDLKSSVQVAPLWIDQKIYVASNDGMLRIFEHGMDKKQPLQIDMEEDVTAAPVFANGVLYVVTRGNLYAIRKEGPAPERGPRPPFVPSPQEVVDKMLKLANVTKDDVVYDLGCGDGRIVVTAAKKYGCTGVGIDIDPACVKLAQENAKKSNVDHLVRIEQQDLYTADFSGASIVTLYLLPSVNVKLLPQLQKLKAGSRVVSHAFDISGTVPDRVVTMVSAEDQCKHSLYLWTLPLKMVNGQ